MTKRQAIKKFTPWLAVIGVVFLAALVYRAFYYAKASGVTVWKSFVHEFRYFFNV